MQQMDITNNGLKLLLLGYGKQKSSSPFELRPLTEVLLIVFSHKIIKGSE
jgi:hypothetical protein